jgi:hypothetical protein
LPALRRLVTQDSFARQFRECCPNTYKAGRGAEYDDTVASRKEAALQHGENDNTRPSPASHSHPPLSDPLIFANRRKAAQKEKVAESAAIRRSDTTGKP